MKQARLEKVSLPHRLITKTFTPKITIMSRQVCGELLFLLKAALLDLFDEQFAEMQNDSLIKNTEEKS